MQSKASTVAEYLKNLPEDRRVAIGAVRKAILANLDTDYEEGMQYGMIGYFVPHRVYPAGYHCDPRQPLPFVGLASQKNHMSVYLMSVYADRDEEGWLRDRFAKAGKKLDMGKCCIRFKRLEDLPVEVIGEAVRRVPVKRHVEYYESALKKSGGGAKKAAAKKKTAAGSSGAKTVAKTKKKAASTGVTKKRAARR